MDINILRVITYGSGRAPADWIQSNRFKIQKLYYIKSGNGWYTDLRGEHRKFLPGTVYLFPYNYEYIFENDKDDPLDHIFLDFISSPPIIADAPIIYEPKYDNGLMLLFRAFEQFYLSSPVDNRFKHFVPYDTINAKHGSLEEKKRIVHRMLSAMLALLSYNTELPVANDKMICDTLDFIRENYMHKLEVKDMAARSGYEVNYFIKRFRSIMRQTPYAYLRDYRIMTACQLISAGETLDSAAVKSGYSDGASLSHAIRATGAHKYKKQE